MSSSYRDDLVELFERRFASDPEVGSGKMMGHPGFKTISNGNFFCSSMKMESALNYHLTDMKVFLIEEMLFHSSP